MIEGAVITFVVIHEMKRAEAALQAHENLSQQRVAALPHLVWTCRSDGLCTHLSPQWVAFTGLAEDQQLGLRWLDQIHPEDRAVVMAAWSQSVALGERFQTLFRLRHHDGAYHFFDTSAVALRDEEGRIVEWFGLSTERQDRPRQAQARPDHRQHRKERGAHHDQPKA